MGSVCTECYFEKHGKRFTLTPDESPILCEKHKQNYCEYCRDPLCDGGKKCGNITMAQTMGEANDLMGDLFKRGELPRAFIENVKQHNERYPDRMIPTPKVTPGVQPIITSYMIKHSASIRDMIEEANAKCRDNIFMAQLQEEFDRTAKEQMDKMLKTNMTAFVADKPHVDLTPDRLQEMLNTVHRETHFYVVECDHLPDDCKGIIYLRKEDAEKFQK